MGEVQQFAVVIGLVAVAVLAAVGSNRLTALIRVPAPAVFLLLAATASELFPTLRSLPVETDERLVTVALVFILFDGGMHIGWHKFRGVAGSVTWLGVVGTVATAGATAVAAHALLGFDWRLSLLIGTALAPTDPAVVFSVLGRREIAGRSGTILEGESGANDPVGIAVMVALLGTSGSGAGAVWSAVAEFAWQILVGAVVGVAGGWALARIFRLPLPNEALYLVRAVAAAGVIYGIAGGVGGSGFLAVLLAGVMVGDVRAPYKREIERFASGIASISEIVAFVVLGLTVSLHQVLAQDVLWPGLLLAALLILVIRPVTVGVLLLPIRLAWGERAFVLWAGLKGAVPILLGTFILSADVPEAQRIYRILFVVVLVSVAVQGALIPTAAKMFNVQMRTVEPEPWALGMRFRDEPEGLHRHTVGAGSPADGTAISNLDLGERAWISIIGRDGKLLRVRGTTVLRAGDDVLAMADRDVSLHAVFNAPPHA